MKSNTARGMKFQVENPHVGIDEGNRVSVKSRYVPFVRLACRKSLLLIAAFCSFAIQAAEIAFTNAGGDKDLSAAANWAGGALPGADDVGRRRYDLNRFEVRYVAE